MAPKPVAMLTDSVSGMSPEMASEYDITVLPTNVVIDGQSYPEDRVNLEEFCRKLPEREKAGKRPTSSDVTSGAFMEAYRKLSKEAASILYIGHSRKLGVAFDAAGQAEENVKAELTQTKIERINSFSTCGAQTLVALEAAKAAKAGKSLPEVVEIANGITKRVNLVLIQNDLSFLVKGGRAHKATSWADSKVTNTSLIRMNISTGGEFVPLGRCRTKGETYNSLFDFVAQSSGKGKVHVVIDHTFPAQAEAEELKKRAMSRLPCAEVFVNRIGPLITLYVDRNARTFSWWTEE